MSERLAYREPSEHDGRCESHDDGSSPLPISSPAPSRTNVSPTQSPSRKRSHERMRAGTLHGSPSNMPGDDGKIQSSSTERSMLPPPPPSPKTASAIGSMSSPLLPSSITASIDRSISPHLASSKALSAGGSRSPPHVPSSTTVSTVNSMTLLPFSQAVSASEKMPPPARPASEMPSATVNTPLPQSSTSTMVASSQSAPQSGQKFEPSSSQADPQKGDQCSDAGTADLVQEDPSTPIDSFNWGEMQQRYHDTVKELEKDEQRVFAEFESLCNFFNLWSQALPQREVERSFKRLKTQMAFVQHEEEELEERRRHYTAVIDAFNSALRMIRSR